jgi:membrane protein required for colicin V production
MTDAPLSVADIGVIAVLLISALWAFVRGFVRELLGVAAWVGAAFVTLYGFGYVSPYTRQLINIPYAADGVAIVALFVLSLILFSIVSHAISSQVRQSSLSAIDRSLGFVFGLLRGAVVVCIAYLLLEWAMPPPQERPVWITSARSLPAIKRGVGLLEELIPSNLRGRGGAAAERVRQEVDRAAQTKRTLDSLNQPQPQAEPSRDRPGYSDKERRDLDRVIEGKQ